MDQIHTNKNIKIEHTKLYKINHSEWDNEIGYLL